MGLQSGRSSGLTKQDAVLIDDDDDFTSVVTIDLDSDSDAIWKARPNIKKPYDKFRVPNDFDAGCNAMPIQHIGRAAGDLDQYDGPSQGLGIPKTCDDNRKPDSKACISNKLVAGRNGPTEFFGPAPIARMSVYQNEPLDLSIPSGNNETKEAVIDAPAEISQNTSTNSVKSNRSTYLPNSTSGLVSDPPVKEKSPEYQKVNAGGLANDSHKFGGQLQALSDRPSSDSWTIHPRTPAFLSPTPPPAVLAQDNVDQSSWNLERIIKTESEAVTDTIKDKQAESAQIEVAKAVDTSSKASQIPISKPVNDSTELPRGFAALAQARLKSLAVGIGETPVAEAGPSGRKPAVLKKSAFPSAGIKSVSEPLSKKRSHKKIENPLEDLKSLNPNKRSTLSSLSTDTLFAPSQIESKNESARRLDAKRQKREERRQQNAAETTDEMLHSRGFEPEDAQIHDSDADALRDKEASDHKAIEKANKEIEKKNKVIEKESSPTLAAEPAVFPIAHTTSIEQDSIRSKPVDHPLKTQSAPKEPIYTVITPPETPKTNTETRPTTSRKTLSKAAQAYNVSNHAGETMPVDLSDRYEAVDVIYHYHVTLRNSSSSGSENTGVEKMFGPYLTLAEANAVAAEEVKHLIVDENGDTIFGIEAYGTGWSFQHAVDEGGMLTETLRVGDLIAEATVSKGICSLCQVAASSRIRSPHS